MIKNQNFQKKLWPQLLDQVQITARSLQILHPFTVIYLENCRIPDHQLAQFINLLVSLQKMREIFFTKIEIGPRSLAAIQILNNKRKNHLGQADFQFHFNECSFVGFEPASS